MINSGQTRGVILRLAAGVIAAIGLAATPAIAERDPDTHAARTHDAKPVPRAQPAAWALSPPVMYLVTRETSAFLSERRERMRAVEMAEPDGPGMAKALTDLAEFHLAHGMAAEGLSLLAGVNDPRLPPVLRLRAAAFELALGLIDPRDRPLTDRALALLAPKHVEWPEQPLFLALLRIREGNMEGAGPLLDDALTRLARFPRTYQEVVLPGFLECAIETRQWRMARDLAAAFDGFAALRDGPAYHFLLGRAAEAGHENVAAFDSYARAMASKDLWGHRARRAIVDLGLKTQSLDAKDAVALLSIEKDLWRGDMYAGDVLRDLASLQLIEGDTVAALETYGAIIASRRGTAMANESIQKAHRLIADFYAKGADGQMPLAAFMAAHDRIARHYRFDPVFADAAEVFADTFLSTGATTVAAREYETIGEYLTVAEDLGLTEPDQERLAMLKLKRAQALLAGGQYDLLADLLLQGVESQDAALLHKIDLVTAQLYSETGQHAETLSTAGNDPAPKLVRLRAQAHFQRENWEASEAAYAELWAIEGADMPFPDAVNFLLASYRNGNMAQTAALADEFPALTSLPGWAAIAAGLSQAAPELLPLRADTARARIENARETLEVMPDVTPTN